VKASCRVAEKQRFFWRICAGKGLINGRAAAPSDIVSRQGCREILDTDVVMAAKSREKPLDHGAESPTDLSEEPHFLIREQGATGAFPLCARFLALGKRFEMEPSRGL
jgi:hypothetical protein